MTAGSEQLDPSRFIITRKRKKYRFALFHNATNCFELSEWQPISAEHLVLEVGAGSGLFLVELAQRHPERTYIALDVKADRLQKGARRAIELGLTNIFFVRARADQLLEVVNPGSVKDIWLTFSDPFPKKRSAKRRLTHKTYLDIYKTAHVRNNAQLLMKTDDHGLFDWSLEQLVANGWRPSQLTYDLHESDFDPEYKVMTSYEQKWTAQGLLIMFVSARSA